VLGEEGDDEAPDTESPELLASSRLLAESADGCVAVSEVATEESDEDELSATVVAGAVIESASWLALPAVAESSAYTETSGAAHNEKTSNRAVIAFAKCSLSVARRVE
jgi:hypothetical protein